MKRAFVGVLWGAVFLLGACGGSTNPPPPADAVGRSMAHMAHLTETIGQRVAGSPGESEALDYIRAEFLAMGYEPEIQPFSAVVGNRVIGSSNVISVLKGKSEREIIVCAHYDSVAVGRGYVDNASGVGLMLAMAERLRWAGPPFTIRFIAFGAEEVGLKGSLYYAANMSGPEIANTIGVINLDSIVGGDMIYAYGGEGDQGWMRDRTQGIAAGMQIDLKTSPGLNPAYPAGTTGDWSDHAPFRELGLAYLYFEATNWDIGDFDGFPQTVKFGEIYHTVNDNFGFLEGEYPGRVASQLRDFSGVLEEFLLNVNPPEPSSRSLLSAQAGPGAILEPAGPGATPMRYSHRDGSPITNLQRYERRP
jgi:hypothetical protein